MAVREFTDRAGIDWRVWDVNPAQLHPVTRTEDYMGNLMDGWLAFESVDGKRRLEAPYPAQWVKFSIPELEALCARAVRVTQRRARTTSGEHQAVAAAELEHAAADVPDSARTFTSPRGRLWTVRLHDHLGHNGTERTVLRFTADDIVLDLEQWPEDWQAAAVHEFALMLLDAEAPRRARPGLQRRRADRPS